MELVVGRPSRNGQLEDASVVALAADNGSAAGKSGAAQWRFRAEARLEHAGSVGLRRALAPERRGRAEPGVGRPGVVGVTCAAESRWYCSRCGWWDRGAVGASRSGAARRRRLHHGRRPHPRASDRDRRRSHRGGGKRRRDRLADRTAHRGRRPRAAGWCCRGFTTRTLHPISGGMRALSCSLVEARTHRGDPGQGARVRRATAIRRAGVGDRRRLGPLAVSGGEPSPVDARRRRPRSTCVPRGRRRSLGLGQLESARDRRHRSLDAGSSPRRDRARSLQRRAQRHPARERGGAGLRRLPPPSAEDRRAALRYALQSAASFGITSMIDPGVDQRRLRHIPEPTPRAS